MANDCYFSMLIKGIKENRDAFIQKMKSYDESNHFYRMYDIEVGIFDDKDEEYHITGWCAWSLETCCRPSGYADGRDLFAVNTSDLDIVMEVWSAESGMGFQEHYIYDKGNCITNECYDYDGYYDEDTEEWITTCGANHWGEFTI